jgi:VWFA-related protein
MRAGDQAGLITYDTGVYTVQPITTDTSALINAIDSLKSGSDTAMYNALMEAEKALANGTGRKAIIVLTDGMDNRSQSTQDDVIAAIGQSGLTISAIGFGDTSSSGQSGLNEGGLRSLADLSGGVYGYATNADALKSLYQQQSRVLQSEYQITFVSPAALRDGINRNITVSLTTSSVVSEGQYNPGGVLPEVSSRSWSTFGYILAGLLILLVLPMVFNGVLSLFRRSKGSYAANRSLGQTPPSMAKGRIKLK